VSSPWDVDIREALAQRRAESVPLGVADAFADDEIQECADAIAG
jgi:hypothetical protein